MCGSGVVCIWQDHNAPTGKPLVKIWLPILCPAVIGGGNQSLFNEPVCSLLTLHDKYRRFWVKYHTVKHVRDRYYTVHVMYPATLAVRPDLTKRLWLKPAHLIDHLTLIVDVVIDRAHKACGRQCLLALALDTKLAL